MATSVHRLWRILAFAAIVLFILAVVYIRKQRERILELEQTVSSATAREPKADAAVSDSRPKPLPNHELPRETLSQEARKEHIARIKSDALARLEAARVARAANTDTLRANREVQRIFGQSLEILGLSPTELRRIKALLSERLLSGQDAYSESLRRKLSRDEAIINKTKIQDAVEKEIISLVAPDKAAALVNVINSEKFLEQIETTFNVDLAFQGIPLEPKQVLDFAEILRTESGRIGADGAKLSLKPSADNPQLSERDAVIIRKIAGAISEPQLKVIIATMQTNFKNALAAQKLIPSAKK